LNTIIGFSEILLSKRIGKLNGEQSKEIGIILKRGKILLSVLDQLIDYTKVLRGEQELRSDLLALNLLLASTVERIRAKRPAGASSLLYRQAKGNYRIRGDEEKLHNALAQIIEAGEEFLQPREIRISLGKEKKQPSGERYRIRIQFLGRGLPDLGELPGFDGDGKIPGKTKFAWHLADFYIRLMKGKLGVSRKRGAIEFTLDFYGESK